MDTGGTPRCRTMVIRGFEPETGSAAFVAHGPGGKMAELTAEARAELCRYFRALSTRFRLSGPLAVLGPEDGPTSGVDPSEVWSDLSAARRALNYWPPPDTPREAADAFPTVPPEPGVAPDFRVGVITVDAVDHLELKPTGHRRTCYRRERDERWSAVDPRPSREGDRRRATTGAGR